MTKISENAADKYLRVLDMRLQPSRNKGLAGADDLEVIEVCRSEGRCVVTLDLDFSNPFRFPPELYDGIAVLRLPRGPTPLELQTTVETLIAAIATESISGKLWIVERRRVRKYVPESD